jgi:hypothetical protein
MTGNNDGEGWDLLSIRPDPGDGPHGRAGDRRQRAPPFRNCPPGFDCTGTAVYLYICVSSYCFIFLYMSPRTESPTLSLLATWLQLFNCTGPARTGLYLCVSSYCCIFVYVSSYCCIFLYMRPHTAVYLSICVLILLYISMCVSSYCCIRAGVEKSLYQTKESTAVYLYICVSSYWFISLYASSYCFVTCEASRNRSIPHQRIISSPFN